MKIHSIVQEHAAHARQSPLLLPHLDSAGPIASNDATEGRLDDGQSGDGIAMSTHVGLCLLVLMGREQRRPDRRGISACRRRRGSRGLMMNEAKWLAAFCRRGPEAVHTGPEASVVRYTA